ncbi:hypothetical protein CALCODRAFT_485861 [Calocera cornea HHB12733]|uniref:Uncharacterized protein n=1 Tax=Calocera cornea HHB12733 TaxID=1353952 RepID=A0A165E3E6_9BASI|nr:hypothetical protein CALCODRAFT_485861 [Calocera cornea HHB12733]
MAPNKPFTPTLLTRNLRSRTASNAPADDADDSQPAGGDSQQVPPPSPPAPPRSLPHGHPPAPADGPPILYPTPAYTYQLRPRPSRPTSGTDEPSAASPRLISNTRQRTHSNSTRGDNRSRPASRQDTPRPQPQPQPSQDLSRRLTPANNPSSGYAAGRQAGQRAEWGYNLREDVSSNTAMTTAATPRTMAPSLAVGQPPAGVVPSVPNPLPQRSTAPWKFTMQGDAASTTTMQSTARPNPPAHQPTSRQPAPRPAAHRPASPVLLPSTAATGDDSVRMVSFEEWDLLTRARPAGPWSLDWWPEGLNYMSPEQWGTRHFWSGELHLDWKHPTPDNPWIPCLHCKKAHWFISTQKNPGAKFFKCSFNRHPEDCRMFSYEGPLRADGKIQLGTVTFPPGEEPDRYPPANLIVRPPERIDPRIAYIRDMRNRENQRRYNELQETFRQARLEGDRIRAEYAARQASQPAGPAIDPSIGAEHYDPGESPLPVVQSPRHIEPPSPTPVIPPRPARYSAPALRRTNTAAFRNQYAEITGVPYPVDTSQDLIPTAGQPSPAHQPQARDSEVNVDVEDTKEDTQADTRVHKLADTGQRVDKGKGKAVEKRSAEEQPDDAPPAQRRRLGTSDRSSETGAPPTTPRGPRSWHGSHTWPIGLAPDPEYVRRDLAALASLPGPQTRLTMLHLAASILADANVLPEETRGAVEGALNREIDEEGRRLQEEEQRREYEDWARRNHRAPPTE